MQPAVGPFLNILSKLELNRTSRRGTANLLNRLCCWGGWGGEVDRSCNPAIMGLLTSPTKCAHRRTFEPTAARPSILQSTVKVAINPRGRGHGPVWCPHVPVWWPIFFLKLIIDFGGVPIMPKTILLLYSRDGPETRGSQSAELPRRRSSLWHQRCIRIYSLTFIIWLFD